MNEKLNIQDLVDLLAEKHGMSKKNADSFVKEFFQLIEESLEKDKYVKIRGLGTFKLIDVESRESVNVNTGERFEIQGHTKVSFTPEPALKDIINKPFSHFETVALNDDTVLEDTPVESGNNEDEEDAEQKTEEIEVQEATEDIEATENKPEESVAASIEEEIVINEEKTVINEEEAVIEVPTVVPEETIEAETEIEEPVTVTESSTMKYFIGIVVFIVMLCAGAVVYLYYPDLFDRLSSQPPMEEVADAKVDKQIENTVVTDTIVDKDTVIVAEADTMPKQPVVKPATEQPDMSSGTVKQSVPADIIPVSRPEKQGEVAYVPDSTSYTIVGTETTHTIKPGETLTKVSLRFYGTKALYPYIVKHNPGVIKKPDNVPAGTTIKIPKLAKKQ